MNMDWHIRLINRIIEKDPDATIKDYYKIVERGEKVDSISDGYGVFLKTGKKPLKKKLELEEYSFSQNGHSKNGI